MEKLYGFERTICACEECKDNCRHLSGMVSPLDLIHWQRQLGSHFSTWASTTLAASPGAIILQNGTPARLRTIVMARTKEGRCVWLLGADSDERCAMHSDAPFGCAYFDHTMTGPEGNKRSYAALTEIAYDWETGGPYSLLWCALWDTGQRVEAPEIARLRLQKP